MKPIEEPMGTPFGRPGKHWAAGYHTGVDFPAEVGTRVVASGVSSPYTFTGLSGGPVRLAIRARA